MKKAIVIVCILCLTLVAFFSGCTNDESSTGNTVTMTTKEYTDAMTMSMTEDTVTLDITSVEEGDTIIIQGPIDEIEYDNSTDATTVSFYSNATADAGGGTSTSITNFIFQGDITSSYQVGDEVKITGKIKHINVPVEQMGVTYNYDMEIFEDQWESEEYFQTNALTGNPYKPLPTTAIEKV